MCPIFPPAVIFALAGSVSPFSIISSIHTGSIALLIFNDVFILCKAHRNDHHDQNTEVRVHDNDEAGGIRLEARGLKTNACSSKCDWQVASTNQSLDTPTTSRMTLDARLISSLNKTKSASPYFSFRFRSSSPTNFPSS